MSIENESANQSPALKNLDLDCSIEQEYVRTVSIRHRKTFGQFFTPEPISEAMAVWISLRSPKNILEPAAGTGVLVHAALKHNPNASITAVELDPNLHQILSDRFKSFANISIIHEDYLAPNLHLEFDALIANPPYVRHHDFKVSAEQVESIQPKNMRIPRTSNSYIYFLVKSLVQLAENGRAVFLIPSDWLNSNYGQFLKQFLIETKAICRIVLFKHDLSAFDDNLSTALLLFIDKSHKSSSCELILLNETFSASILRKLGDESLPIEIENRKKVLDLSKLSAKDKWLNVFDFDFTQSPQNWISLGFLASSSRGIATGANSFFHVAPSTVSKNHLSLGRARNCIGRARDVKGLIFSKDDFRELENNDGLSYLLDLDELESVDSNYLELGIKQELPKRFLLRQRQPWYKQELRKPAPVWIGVFGREGIRFIWNKAGIHNLTTFHCLYPEIAEEDIGALVALLNGSILQDLNRSSERAYGSGLRKVEPRDVLQMKVPDIRNLNRDLKDQLSRSLEVSDLLRREGRTDWRDPIDRVISDNFEQLNRSVN